jgi:uncharacterized protein YbjT (DUF2867 family)
MQERMALRLFGAGMSQISADACSIEDYLAAAADGRAALPSSLVPYIIPEPPATHPAEKGGVGQCR